MAAAPADAPRAPCLHCGAAKPSPLAPCEACGHVVDSAEDQARHLVAADLPGPARDELVEVVRRGEEAVLDEAEVAAAREAVEAATPARVALFAMAMVVLPVGVVVLGLAAVAFGLLAL